MSFFDSLFNWGRGGWRRLSGSGDAAHPFEYANTESGPSVTPAAALKLSAVWGCVNLRSATISSLPLHLRAPDKSHATSHPLYSVLHDAPNADMTASEFWEMQLASLDMWGNAYSLIERSGRRVISLSPLRPERMTVRRSKSGEVSYSYRSGEKDIPYSEDQIFHLKGFTLDGLVGLSPLQYAAETVGGLMSANRAAAREWQNGMQHGGIIGTPQLTDDQRARFRRHLREHQGPDNAGRSMLLEEPFKVIEGKSLRINPADAQLLQSRYFGIEEICRAFRVPPQLIGHTDKASSWASSLENTNLGFLMYSLRPTLVRIEQAITKQLLAPEERASFRAKFAVEGLLRGDSAARTSFYSVMMQNGVFSRNHVRDLEDLPPVAGGDVLTVQLNLTTLDKIGAESPSDGAKRALMNWLSEETPQ